MARSLIRRMVYALVAVQLLLSVPVASVMAGGVAATMVASPCADMGSMDMDMDMDIGSTVPDPQSNPCCPDQSTGAVNCLVACAGVMAGLPAAGHVLAASVSVPAVAPVLTLHVLPADPPLNPPPIV